MTEQVLSKKVDLPCSVSDKSEKTFGFASIFLAIIFPTVIGPAMVIRKVELRNLLYVFFLTTTFLTTYITSMIICEHFLPAGNNLLYFVIIKYIVGTSHHLLGPISILISRRDICKSAIQVYRRGGTTQNKTFEITAEQMQKELGLGVNP